MTPWWELALRKVLAAALEAHPLLVGPGDSARAMAAVAQGIGFLGAGAILQARGEIRWLTTAASLWAAAALGVATGLGAYLLAILGGLLIYAILHWVPHIEERWIHGPEQRSRGTEPRAEDGGHEGDRA